MPSAPILNLGARWRAADVYWATTTARLLGVKLTARRGPTVNFAEQSGIYVLYANFVPIYVGQASGTLFWRLKAHYLTDDLAGRWDRFSWFGFRRVIGGNAPSLSIAGANFSISTKQLLDHLEAILIHAFEPPLNGQEGRFGKSVMRYAQVRDDRVGPLDRELIEGLAIESELVGATYSPFTNRTITRRGWK